MGAFAEEMRVRLPAGMSLPEEIAALFDWIEERGLLHASRRVPGDRFGTLQPLDGPALGAVALFRVESPAEARDTCEAWFGDAGIGARLVPFARTGADGSYAAFWLDEAGLQRIVHLGSEGDGLCVLGRDPVDFLRLLAIGHSELCNGLADPHEPPGEEADNPPFRDWLRTRFGVAVPATVAEIVPNPPDSFAAEIDDPFWQFVRRTQERRDGASPSRP